MSTIRGVQEYLETVKRLVRDKRTLFVERAVNLAGLLELKLTKKAAVAELLLFDEKCFSSGPHEDRDRSGQHCWIFGHRVGTREVYVKLIVETLPTGLERLKVLSFHPADAPLNYPFLT